LLLRFWRRHATYQVRSDVRGRWQKIEDSNAHFTTSPEPNGEPRIDAFFKLAQRLFVFDDFRYIHQDAALTDGVAVPVEFDAPTPSDPPNSAIA